MLSNRHTSRIKPFFIGLWHRQLEVEVPVHHARHVVELASDYASDDDTTHPSDEWIDCGEVFASLVAGIVAAHGRAPEPIAYRMTVAQMLLPAILH